MRVIGAVHITSSRPVSLGKMTQKLAGWQVVFGVRFGVKFFLCILLVKSSQYFTSSSYADEKCFLPLVSFEHGQVLLSLRVYQPIICEEQRLPSDPKLLKKWLKGLCASEFKHEGLWRTYTFLVAGVLALTNCHQYSLGRRRTNGNLPQCDI